LSERDELNREITVSDNQSAATQAGTAPPDTPAAGVDPAQVVKRVGRRLMPYVFALYFMSIVDRGNLGFAALAMNSDLHLTREMFGFGVGIFFLTFALFELPSNLALARFGARATLTRIAILWGLATMLMAFVSGPNSFYGMRALLGAAEAGIAPGVFLFLSYWFPTAYRARYNAVFIYAVPVAYAVASVVSGWIMQLDGALGLPGWKWLFLLEGLPAILLGLFGLWYLTNKPTEAHWLSATDRLWLQGTLDREAQAPASEKRAHPLRVFANPNVLLMASVMVGIFCGLATLNTWLPLIIRGFGVPLKLIGPLAALPSFAGAVGMFLTSRHSDRHRERVWHLIGALLFAALGYVAIALSTSLALTILGFVLANIGIYSANAVFWTIPQSFLPKNMTAAGLGIISTVASLAGFGITTLVGHIQEKTHNLTSCFAIVIAVLLVVAVIAYILGRRLKRMPDTSLHAAVAGLH
jgi:MFS transporter, ACS family, tartrate transporter